MELPERIRTWLARLPQGYFMEDNRVYAVAEILRAMRQVAVEGYPRYWGCPNAGCALRRSDGNVVLTDSRRLPPVDRAWVDSLTPSDAVIIASPEEIFHWYARRRTIEQEEARRLIPRALLDSKVPVTRQDSYDAGNCRRTTDRIALWFGGQSVPVSVLLGTIAQLRPRLIPYAIRAAEVAVRRAAQTTTAGKERKA